MYIPSVSTQNYLFCRLLIVVKNVWTLNLINQLIKIHYKSPKLLSKRIIKRYYKNLGTSMGCSPLPPLSLIWYLFIISVSWPWMQDYKLKWKTELCIMSSSKVSLYYSFQGSFFQGRIKGWGVMFRRGVGLRFEPITSPTSSGYTFVLPRSRVKLSILFLNTKSIFKSYKSGFSLLGIFWSGFVKKI